MRKPKRPTRADKIAKKGQKQTSSYERKQREMGNIGPKRTKGGMTDG